MLRLVGHKLCEPVLNIQIPELFGSEDCQEPYRIILEPLEIKDEFPGPCCYLHETPELKPEENLKKSIE